MENTNAGDKAPLHFMFTSVPPHYDLVNSLITFGMDRRWRRLAAAACLEAKPQRILDLGCGTGDLTIKLAKLADAGVEINGLDYSEPMLELATAKATRRGVISRVKFIHGDATKLPFPGGYFDCVGISFAFRNLTYNNPVRETHFKEVHRVLRPGGRYVIVETSQPHNPVMRALFHLYLRAYARPVGRLISGYGGAYRYLAESAARFYNPDEVRAMLLAAGFTAVKYRPLCHGVAGVHIARK